MSHLKTLVPTMEDKEQLYKLLSEHAQTQGLAHTIDPEGNASEMAFKLPGLPLHLSLSSPSREELTHFITAAAILAGCISGGLAGVGISLVTALATRLQLLQARFGEVCIVEVLAEVKRPTERNTCTALLGSPCRRPKAECQFMSDESICNLDLASLQATLKELESRHVVKRLNAVEPIQFGVVV